MDAYLVASFGIAFIGLGIAAYTDLKTRIVEDYISYGMILLGIAIHLIQSVHTQDWTFLLTAIGSAVGSFIGGYLLWKIGFWAGGDVKLFTGIGALLPFNPNAIQNVFGIATGIESIAYPVFPFTLFLFSVFAMLPLGLGLAVVRLRDNKEFQTKLKTRFIQAMKSNAFFALTLAGTNGLIEQFHLSSWFYLAPVLAWIGLPKRFQPVVGIVLGLTGIALLQLNAVSFAIQTWIALCALWLLFRFTQAKELFRSQKPVSKLEEGDIVGVTIVERNHEIEVLPDSGLQTLINNLRTQNYPADQRTVASSLRAGGLEKSEIEELQKLASENKIPNTLPVKESTPFVPAVLIGFVILNLIGDIAWKLILK